MMKMEMSADFIILTYTLNYTRVDIVGWFMLEISIAKETKQMRLIDADALFAALNKKRLVYHAEIDTAILNMPTIDPKPKWIPVAERLPEPFLTVLIWYTYFMFEIDITPEQTYGFGFVNLDGNWYIEGGGEQKKVIAWIPLPEPYDPAENK